MNDKEFGPTEQQVDPEYIKEVEEEIELLGRPKWGHKKKFKPTKPDTTVPHAQLAGWTPQQAFLEQAEREAWAKWAEKPPAPLPTLPPLKNTAWKPSYGFVVQIYKFIAP